MVIIAVQFLALFIFGADFNENLLAYLISLFLNDKRTN